MREPYNKKQACDICNTNFKPYDSIIRADNGKQYCTKCVSLRPIKYSVEINGVEISRTNGMEVAGQLYDTDALD